MNVVFYSSGIGSWAAAKRVAQQHGSQDLVLLFADTLIEDPDNYRFLEDGAKNIGGLLVKVADGRTPFEVFRKERLIGNSRIAPCSHILKQTPCLRWLKQNDPAALAALFVGIGWDEIHRLPAIVRNWAPWTIHAPMTDPPYLDRLQILNWVRQEGLEPPRSYQMGFPHSNCLQRGCIKGGIAYWRHVLRTLPESFALAEEEEAALRSYLGKDHSHLTKSVNGQKMPYTLEQLRLDESVGTQSDLFDWGGCGCFADKQ